MAPRAQEGRPLHLLQYDEATQKFELGEEALDALRQIRGPVGVLAVCGRARQGKSFILNQLVGKGLTVFSCFVSLTFLSRLHVPACLPVCLPFIAVCRHVSLAIAVCPRRLSQNPLKVSPTS